MSAGLGPVEMNVFTELWNGMQLGSYTSTHGWHEEQITQAVASLQARGWLADGALTEEGRTVRNELEAATDAAQWPVVHALGSSLDDVAAQLPVWGDACVAAGVFPADVLKRACG